MIKEEIQTENGIIKVDVMETITTIIPTKKGVSFSVQSKHTGKKANDNWIIVDKDGCYWSEEEKGRYSNGALYEKTFETKKQAQKYIDEYKIDGGFPISHSTHWTGKMPITFDTGKPAGLPISEN